MRIKFIENLETKVVGKKDNGKKWKELITFKKGETHEVDLIHETKMKIKLKFGDGSIGNIPKKVIVAFWWS